MAPLLLMLSLDAPGAHRIHAGSPRKKGLRLDVVGHVGKAVRELRVDHLPSLGHFRDLPRPMGHGGFSLAIAELCVRFEGLDAELLESARGRYAPFLCEEQPQHTVTLYPGAAVYLDPAADGFLRVLERPLEGARLYLSTDFAAWWADGTGAGILRVSNPEDREATLRAMENYLRWVTAGLALRREAFVLHAAGLVREGKAYVFFGPSGAGKSTVAALSPGCGLLSDDLVLLLRRDGRWMAAATPFKGTLSQSAKKAGTFPLEGLFRLVQAPRHAAKVLTPARGLATLLASCPFVTDPAARHDRLMTLAADCCRQTGVRELQFAKDSGFWESIAGEK